MVSSGGWGVVLSSAIAGNVDLFRLLKAFQHVGFPLPANLQVTSVPVIEWKAGKAAALEAPIA